MFATRKHAGTLLSEKIKELDIDNPLIIGIPRGGVEIAEPIAQNLPAPLFVTLPRKIGAPFNPEYAVGALAPDGTINYDEFTLAMLGLTYDDLNPVIAREQQEITKRLKLYGSWGQLPDLNNHSVILVDDGIATGYTVRAAIDSLKKQAYKLILAVPVLPHDLVDPFAASVDKLIYLEAPVDFRAVGLYYKDFSELSHKAVINILENANKTM